MLDVDRIKADFPIFNLYPKLVYLDSAAMSLKPYSVIQAVEDYYKNYSANVFRGIYQLSEKATQAYEATRKKVSHFINAADEREIVFVRNTTEAINLIAYAWGRVNLEETDEIVTTIMEHHSNFLPWQILAGEVGAVFKVIDIDSEGFLACGPERSEGSSDRRERNYASLDSSVASLLRNDIGGLENIITKKTKILALTYVSNALGTINPVKEIISVAKKINPKVITVVDAAQSVPHMKVDVQKLGCDFLAFSGQKMLGPTGAGVLWGKRELLETMPPFLFGGEMIREVYLDRTVFAEPPHKFEAGTPHIAGVIGLAAAIDYLTKIGMEKIKEHEKNLTQYALRKLEEIDDLIIYGPKEVEKRGGVVSFNLKGVHPHDVASVLDGEGICVRSGHHCAMPLYTRLKINASVRATFYLYNNKEDIDKLFQGLLKVRKIFK